MAELTADEAAVYDRQLRVWGLETQQRLRQSKVLILGCTGLAAEISKNIVLAGVGLLTLVDDTPCDAAASGNFLIHHDAPEQTAAEACVATLKEMNPLVSVTAVSGAPSSYLTAESVANYNIVILIGQSGAVVHAADAMCTEKGVAFIATSSRGYAGWAFANVHSHNYVVETKVEQSDGTVKKTTEKHKLEGVSWENALAAKMEKRNIKRMSPLLPILRVIGRFEVAEGRPATPSDLATLQSAVEALIKDEKMTGGGALDTWALSSFLEQTEEMPAINAIVGGVVANDIIKIVAENGEPLINNMFLYSLLDGAGWVERLC